MKFIRNMFGSLFKSGRHRSSIPQLQNKTMAPDTTSAFQDSLATELNTNEQMLRAIYTNCPDVVFRSFRIGGNVKAMLLYIEGLSDVELIDQQILAPLMQEAARNADGLKQMIEQKIPVSKITELRTYTDCIEQVSSGNPVVIVDHEKAGLAFSMSKWEKRAVDEPAAEGVVRGPREGFTESLGVNTSLLRRKLRSPSLKMISIQVGRYTWSEVVVVYLEGLAAQALLDEVINRLKRIDIDGVLETAYLEELIEDKPFSLFPQILSTERPDVVAANLLEGRVAIMLDGTPFALVVPITFYSLLQSSEDYYQRYWFSSAIRWLRYGALVISVFLPSVYVAVLTYHQEMVPSTLYISVAKSRETIPFPVLVEAFLMEITFEMLREAGVRLPKQIGAAVSIVGALVIGQAAVSAGIVSAPMVMVVAITGISSFMIPRYTVGIALRLLRFPVMLLAGTLGLLGVMLGIIVSVVHMCSIRSFGVPYLSPMEPMKGRDMKDVMMRAPFWMLNTRPHLTGEMDEYRQSPGQKPGPSQGTE